MEAMAPEKRAELGRMLETRPQREVMALIPQFEEARVFSAANAPVPALAESIHALIFNMERGIHGDALIDFLKYCPQIKPFDLILANELDDGCTRSGERDVADEIGRALNMHYVFALEFIELTQKNATKGYHGNAVFSRYPIKWAKTLHLPEEYNWYFDRQIRIGCRCAVFAEIDVNGRSVGVVSAHLENRTDGQGRLRQMQSIYRESKRLFAGIPVLLGGDLNTNAFDGRSKEEIQFLAKNPEILRQRLACLEAYEPLLSAANDYGFEYKESAAPGGTRRKPLPDGSTLLLRLDWLLSRGLEHVESRMISTEKGNCGFAPAGSALESFKADELSDHNAVWARYRL
jgi:endonuclease/exonuclease/phosphatase family metal-dependent hydrolase